MEHTFRYTPRYWRDNVRNNFILTLFWTVVALGLYAFFPHATPFWAGSLLFGIITFAFAWHSHSISRVNYITVTPDYIESRYDYLNIRNHVRRLTYKEIKYVEIQGGRKSDKNQSALSVCIILYADPHLLLIWCEPYFDDAHYEETPIWELLQRYVPRTAFHVEAMLDIARTQDWYLEAEQIPTVPYLHLSENKSVDLVWYILGALVGVTIEFIALLQSGRGSLIAGVLFCGLVVLIVIEAIATLEWVTMNVDEIGYHSLFNRYGIQWGEITLVETTKDKQKLLIHGSNKRLIIPAPFRWAGPDKLKMRGVWLWRLHTQAIPQATRIGHVPEQSKNVKLP